MDTRKRIKKINLAKEQSLIFIEKLARLNDFEVDKKTNAPAEKSWPDLWLIKDWNRIAVYLLNKGETLTRGQKIIFNRINKTNKEKRASYYRHAIIIDGVDGINYLGWYMEGVDPLVEGLLDLGFI